MPEDLDFLEWGEEPFQRREWGEEPFQRREVVERYRGIPCKRGRNCVVPGCEFKHPEVEHVDPGEKNALVVVLREDDVGDVWLLVQRRGLSAPTNQGLLASIGGKREESDRDSMQTAIREVWEETGLLDLGRLVGAPADVLRAAEEAEEAVRAPLLFRIFHTLTTTDLWVLLLDGEGSFRPAPDANASADIAPLLPELPGAVAAPAFGHAWVPVKSIFELKNKTIATDHLRVNVRQAVHAILFG